jgi:iron uptake system component EfeO
VTVRRVAVALAVLSLAALAGCGGDDDSDATSGGASGDALDIVAQDIKFPSDTYEATAGSVDVAYRNDGSITHTLVIDGVDGFKLEVVGNGDADVATVDLDAGTYTLYCDVAGHREAGMEATLEVS